MYHIFFSGKQKHTPIFQFLLFFYFPLVMNADFQNIHAPILNKKNLFQLEFRIPLVGTSEWNHSGA